jgi:DNA-binding transcriptional ArsR family regulator
VMEEDTKAKKRDDGQRKKGIEKLVPWALNHPIRIEILTLLNEGVYTPNEVSEITGETLANVSYHIAELADGGAIELARTSKAGNWTRHHYRAVEQPYISEEQALAMTFQQRQIMAGVVLQCGMAEALAAFRRGNMAEDPRNVMLSWSWFNVDKEGHREIIEALAACWEQLQLAETRSTARRVKSKEAAISVIVSVQGFLRSRFSPNRPAPQVNPE